MSELPVEIAQLGPLISAKTMDRFSWAQICFLSNEAKIELGPASQTASTRWYAPSRAGSYKLSQCKYGNSARLGRR